MYWFTIREVILVGGHQVEVSRTEASSNPRVSDKDSYGTFYSAPSLFRLRVLYI
jgi:hypothetical protein